MFEAIENARKFVLYHALVIWRTKAFWMRALLCFAVGSVILISDDHGDVDSRLQMRGARRSDAPVVIIDVSERDWTSIVPESRNVLRPLKEVVTVSDAFFWSRDPWEKILHSVLSQNPSSVGVMFFFGESVRSSLPNSSLKVFEDPRVIWGADVDSAGRVLFPAFSANYGSNVGLRSVWADDDGTVRRFSSSVLQVPHIAIRLSEIAKDPKSKSVPPAIFQRPTLINYAGGNGAFEVVSVKDVIDGHVKPDIFTNRVVLIGNLQLSTDQLQTPIGRMSRTEVVANIVDNVMLEKSIHLLPSFFYLALLALLMAGSLWVLASYPQSVALVFFVMAGIIGTAMSVWAFDVAYLWLPVLAPLVQLTVTYIVFMSYRLSLNEQRTWRMQQEAHYLSEIEQLKTNFVSMMSHDLKTPIAKIQAIVDRLVTAMPDSEIVNDLRSLRRSSDDLHRYIQSILQVTKVEAKDFKINKEVTDINENIEKVIARLQPLAQEKKISIDMKLEPMFSIEADTTLLQEVIHNLVENAIKYTPEGGQIAVSSSEKDENVEVSVVDTGPGIPSAEQSEIWGKFTRGRGQTDAKGSGLGLYLVKYFVELHGGRVFLSSAAGQGTNIGFSIPIAEEGSA